MDSDDDEEHGSLPSEHVRAFTAYIASSCATALAAVVRAPDPSLPYGVDVDLIGLQNAAPAAAAALLTSPARVMPLLQRALAAAVEAAADAVSPNDPAARAACGKPHVHARVCHLPATPAYTKQNVSMLRTGDVGKLLAVLGTVTRAGSVMLREVRREYMCARCKHAFWVDGDITQRGAFDLPARCPSSSPAPGGRPAARKICLGAAFAPVESAPPVCHEYQEIKVQEKIQNLDVGSIPRSLLVVLTDDLADTAKPGDDVVVSGVLHRRWNKPLAPDARVDVQLMLAALHIATNNEQKSFLHVDEDAKATFAAHWNGCPRLQQLRARNAIIRSVCPQIYGMYFLKLILAMSLVGGVSYRDPSGARIRGESHLLIVGDPGTAKSQFLRYAAKVSPRSVLTTGIGTTSAGLTVTAVREQGTGEWMLDAGALVLADGGICCIDEFDGIREHDRGAIHEAMEQQTLSVAKAGLVCTLDTRATVLAAVNPKGGKISTEIGGADGAGGGGGGGGDGALQISVGIASPLLSRFDVVLTLLDQRNEEWDRQLSSFILNGYAGGADAAAKEATKGKRAGDGDGGQGGGGPAVWSAQKLQQYIFHIKCNLRPRLSKDAQRILTKYYAMERTAAGRNAARTTVRLLEALVRLTQAHARLMFRETATTMDAVFALAAVEASAASMQVVGGMGALHAPFPEDPDADYRRYAHYILVKLGLEGEIDVEVDDDAPVGGADGGR
jgi:DNA helicase MCM9